jgi:hypothetical protein
MRGARLTALLSGAALALALGASCGKSKPVGVDPTDAGGDGKPAGLASCLDSPDQLTRPPSTTLPCELLPPGLAL